MEVQDIHLSIRFKHGVHTIFLFVDPAKPFGKVAEDLLEVLRERYPTGLTTSTTSPGATELPNDHMQIVFAVPKKPTDLSQGWTPLKVGEQDSFDSKGIKHNSVVAFAFRPEDANESYTPEFEVAIPSFEEEDGGQQ